jgi:hypothetical protein
MTWVAVAVGGVSIASSLIAGGSQKRKARRQLDELNKNKPVEALPTEIGQSLQLAQLRSNTGLPSEQYNMAMKDINRQQSRSLKKAGDRGQALGLVAALDDNANRSIERLGVENANARSKNERVLMDVNSQVGNWKRGIYDRNVRQPWMRNYDYSMGLLGQGNQNTANAINSGIGLAGNALLGGATGKMGKGFFGNKSKGSTGSGPTSDPTPTDDYGNNIDEYGNTIQ